jgi:hypothetical protein
MSLISRYVTHFSLTLAAYMHMRISFIEINNAMVWRNGLAQWSGAMVWRNGLAQWSGAMTLQNSIDSSWLHRN